MVRLSCEFAEQFHGPPNIWRPVPSDTNEIPTQESTSDGFDFTSDSDRISDRLLYMRFAGYFTVTEMQLKFPAGDTYKFGLWIYNEADGTHEPYVIVTVGNDCCVERDANPNNRAAAANSGQDRSSIAPPPCPFRRPLANSRTCLNIAFVRVKLPRAARN